MVCVCGGQTDRCRRQRQRETHKERQRDGEKEKDRDHKNYSCFFFNFLFFFSDRPSLYSLGWPSKSQSSSCLSLPGSGMTNVSFCAWFGLIIFCLNRQKNSSFVFAVWADSFKRFWDWLVDPIDWDYHNPLREHIVSDLKTSSRLLFWKVPSPPYRVEVKKDLLIQGTLWDTSEPTYSKPGP